MKPLIFNLIFSFLLVLPTLSADGLTGKYYNNDNFTNLLHTRVDSIIKFSWGKGKPYSDMKKNHFSITWEGYIYIPEDSDYTFSIAHDDEFKLVIDGTTIYDDTHWTGGSNNFRDVVPSQHLNEGYYSISIHFVEGVGGAYSKLAWSNTNSISSREIIPTNNLFTAIPVVNNPPTDIALSSSDIDENEPIDTDIGTLSTTDADTGDTHTYSLVSGTGDTDNSSFTITGDTVKSNEVFDFETKSSYSIRVQTDDSNGGTYEKAFTITINDIADTGIDFTCANPREFTKVFSQNIPGQVEIIGNSVLCRNTSGQCGDPLNKRNNGINMMYINVDTDPTTFNHSSAELTIPADSEIVWAGLYWQGIFAGPTAQQQEDSAKVKLKVPNGNYIDIVAESNKFNWIYLKEPKNRWYYQAAKEITNLIDVNNPNGYYEVANIQSTQGKPKGGSFGGWSIAVVYLNDSLAIRNLTVFDGYQGIMPGGNGATCADRSSDPRRACLYASDHNCSIALKDTGVANPIDVTLDGFLTPKSGIVESQFIIFTGEGDRNASGDKLSLTDKTATKHFISNAQNPQNDIQNATISKNGLQVTTLEPQATLAGGTPWINSLGVDIDSFNIDGLLSNEQKSTVVTMNTNGDGYFPGVFGFSSELYEPKFCYDYAYQQLGRTYTEENNGTQEPRINANFVSSSAPIKVAIYIRNEEDSDVIASDLILNIRDINISQATYKNPSLFVTYPNSSQRVVNTPDSASLSDIDGIHIGDLSSSEYFWTYFDLNPKQNNINFPLDVSFEYTLKLPIGGGNYFEFHTSSILGKNMPMCSSSNSSYLAGKSIFNIAQKDLYINHSLYNIPTQVTKRVDDFMLVSYDPAHTDTENNVSTIVAVELIDAGKYHDFNASCFEPDSALSPRIWVLFENNTSRANFTRSEISNAITNGLVSDKILNLSDQITVPEDLFSKARENTSFRLSYVTSNDGNATNVAWKRKANGRIEITNYAETVDVYGPTCANSVLRDLSSSVMLTTVNDACSESKSLGLSDYGFARCMECIYPSSTNYICSRDNFAIRPEAFLLKLNDMNQTTSTQKTRIADDRSGVLATPNSNIVNLASGYTYNLEVNATDHISNNSSDGYIRGFGNDNSNFNLTLEWKPDNTSINPNCNEIVDFNQTSNIINGKKEHNLSISQTGKYLLKMYDKTWTKVDYDPKYTAHHAGVGFSSGSDCVKNNSDVPDVPTTTASLSGNDLNNVSGCDISSNHTHNNSTINKSYKYRNYSIEYHPYKFSLDGIIASTGLKHQALPNNPLRAYVYMADIYNNNYKDQNMSFHLNGSILALGYNNDTLSNFVDGCYAKNIDLNITKSDTTLLNPINSTPIAFQINFQNLDVNGTVIAANTLDMNDSNTTLTIGIATPTTYFTKSLKGTLSTILNLNYERNISNAINPKAITFSKYDVNCSTPTECTFFADLKPDKKSEGSLLIDNNAGANGTILYYYARNHSPRYRFSSKNGTAFIYYEVFCNGTGCDKTLLQDSTTSKTTDDPRWFINTQHNNGFGSANSITQKNNTVVSGTDATGNHQDSSSISYNETRGYPYKTTMETNSSNWLIYNKYNANATRNSFEVEFTKEDSKWAGIHETNSSTKKRASSQTNRRSMW